MPKLTKGSEFDSMVCVDCPVAEICAAGKLLFAVRTAANDLPSIIGHYAETVGEYIDPTPGTSEISTMSRRMGNELVRAKRRYDGSVKAAEQVVGVAIQIPHSRVERMMSGEDLNNVPIEEVLDAPMDIARLELDEPITLGTLKSSVLHYAKTGVCGAVSVSYLNH